jgi:hypothetical protein
MADNINDVFLQVQEDAEQCGSAFAETALELFSDDEAELGSFVDKLFDFYYVADDRQFIDFLVLLSDVYGISLSPEIETYRTDDEGADVFISVCLETFLYAVMTAVGTERDLE